MQNTTQKSSKSQEYDETIIRGMLESSVVVCSEPCELCDFKYGGMEPGIANSFQSVDKKGCQLSSCSLVWLFDFAPSFRRYNQVWKTGWRWKTRIRIKPISNSIMTKN